MPSEGAHSINTIGGSKRRKSGRKLATSKKQQLNEEIDKLKQEIKGLIEKGKLEAEEYQKQVEKMDTGNKALKDELMKTKESLKEHEQKVSSEETEKGKLEAEEYQKQVEKMDTENKALKDELMKTKESLKEHEQKVSSEETEKGKLEAEEFQKQVEKMDTENKALKDELMKTKESLKEHEQKVSSEETEKGKMEGEGYQNQLEEKSNEIKALKDELMKTKESLKEHKQNVSSEETGLFQAKIEGKQKANDNSMEQFELTELSHVNNIIGALTEEIKKYEEDISSLKDCHGKLLNDNNSMLDKLCQKDDEINQLITIAKECEENMDRFCSVISETAAVLETTFSKLKLQEKDVEHFKVDIERGSELNAILHEEISKLKHDTEENQLIVVEYQNKCRDLEKEDCLNKEEISKLTKQVVTLKDEISKLKHDTKQNQVRIVEYKNKCRDLEKKDCMNEEAISNLTTQVVTLKAKLYDDNKDEDISLTVMMYQNKLGEMIEENETQIQNIQEQTTTIHQLNEQIYVLNVQLDRCKCENSTLLDDSRTQNETLKTREAHICLLESELVSIKKSKEDVQNKNDAMTGEIEKYKRGHIYLQKLKEDHEHLLKKNDLELSNLKSSLDAKISEIAKLTEHTKSLEVELSKANECCKQLRSKLLYLEEDCKEKDSRIDELKVKNQELNATIARQHIQSAESIENCEQLQRTISSLEHTCGINEQRLCELESTNRDLNTTIAKQYKQLADISAGHNNLIAAHGNAIVEGSRQNQHVRELEERLKIAQDDVNRYKEAYEYCVQFRQQIHASRLNQERDDNISFHESMPEESFIDALRKENLELKDAYANITLESFHLASSKQELSEQMKQLRTQLIGYQGGSIQDKQIAFAVLKELKEIKTLLYPLKDLCEMMAKKQQSCSVQFQAQEMKVPVRFMTEAHHGQGRHSKKMPEEPALKKKKEEKQRVFELQTIEQNRRKLTLED